MLPFASMSIASCSFTSGEVGASNEARIPTGPPHEGGSWSLWSLLDAFKKEAAEPDAKEYILMYRYNHCAYRAYWAMHYLLVKVPIEEGDVSVSGKVAYCHKGQEGELAQWYSSGFHGWASVNVRQFTSDGPVLDVDSVEFHYLGDIHEKEHFKHVLDLRFHLPGRDGEQHAYHVGRTHPNNQRRRIAMGEFWATLSKCTPENTIDYDGLLRFLLNCPEMPFGADRAAVALWR